MAENEKPKPNSEQPPLPGSSSDATAPTPPPSPYEQPPLPGYAAPSPYQQPPLPSTTPQGSNSAAPTPSPAPTQPAGVQPPYPQQPYPPQVPPMQQPVNQQVYNPYAPQPPYYSQMPQPSQPYGTAQQPPYTPYPPQPPYQGAPQQPKKKVWPWVLLGCLIVFLLGIGGCVSCTAVMFNAMENSYERSYSTDNYPYGDYYDYDVDPGYNYGGDTSSSFSLADIKEAANGLQGKVVDGKCTPGVYEVGTSKDIAPGLYFLEGSQTKENNYLVFSSNDDGTYDLDDAVVYFGNYFTQLEKGDVIAFTGTDDLRFYEASKATFTPQAPYQSGVYRVGTDIAAGTYSIQPQAEAVKVAEQDSAAFVMKDLEFDTDSITDTKYVIKGSVQTVTVKDGDYLELYAATATPTS